MNAFTSYDLTCYFITVPSNKLELWAWMESDRLHDSVFREFYSERDVVHEERRLRTESTPTGKFEEQFDAMFWASSGYSWPVIGWPSDLNSYTFEQAQEYWNVYYRPGNLFGILVGDFDPAEAKRLITRYFSRLEPGDREPPPVVTLEVEQLAEQRMIAAGDFPPAVEIRYHTVPAGHADSYAARHARRDPERADRPALRGPGRGPRASRPPPGPPPTPANTPACLPSRPRPAARRRPRISSRPGTRSSRGSRRPRCPSGSCAR